MVEQPIAALESVGTQIQAVRFVDSTALSCDALFIRPKTTHRTTFAHDLGCQVNEHNVVQIDIRGRTSIEGVYAAGDIASPMRSVAIAVAQGAAAAYGINAEYFIPEISLGLFGRYGYYENTDLDEDGDAFNFGVNVYDLFLESDRLGVGYGQALSNDQLRQDNDDDIPSVLEVFYDFRLLPGLRVGVSYQSLNEFSESIAGFRVRGDFNLTPRQP